MIFLQKNRILFLIFIFGGVLGFFWNFYSSWINSWEQNSNLIKGNEDVFTSKKIIEARRIIENEYYHFNEKTKEEIENAMISAMVWSLWDRHSTYFPPKEAKEFSEVLRWDFEGIWAVIDEHMKWIIIRKIFPSSPAEKAGLQDGDILTYVGNESLLWLTTEQAVKKIRWPKGSKTQITYLRGEKYSENKTEVTRDTIIVPSTQEKILSGSIGYIEIAFFGEHTREEFQKSFHNLISSGATWIILDFRNNWWGYLDSAVDVLSFLLPDKKEAVITRENDIKKTQILFTKKIQNTNEKIPLVMIVNGLSASATEIVAWALQDYSRSIIVWEKSYGKWSVQEPFILGDGSILKITIGRWYTPKDRGIDGNGISPDVPIPIFEKDFTNHYDRQLEWAKKVLETLIQTKNSQETIEKMKKEDFTK